MGAKRSYAVMSKVKKISARKRVKRSKGRVPRPVSAVKNKRAVVAGQGFPKNMVMTHKYCDVIAITCASGVPQPYVFSCNGMYDPNITSTGHQPLYFDQMSALYNHYTVIGSKITCRFTPLTSANQLVPTYVGCFINDDATVSSGTLSTLLENSLVKTRLIAYGNTKTTSLTHKWSAKKYFPGSTLANDNLQGTIASNPAEQSTFTLFACSLDTTTSVQIYAEVEISYIAVWTELKEIAGS